MCLNNAAAGVGATDFVNAYASGISVAASWNSGLAYERGFAMGGEFRTKGVNLVLGPGMYLTFSSSGGRYTDWRSDWSSWEIAGRRTELGG